MVVLQDPINSCSAYIYSNDVSNEDVLSKQIEIQSMHTKLVDKLSSFR
jgi:hypothetical protein